MSFSRLLRLVMAILLVFAAGLPTLMVSAQSPERPDRIEVAQFFGGGQQQQQRPRRRTLMDMLFGGQQEQQRIQQEQQVRQRPQQQRRAAPVAALPPPKPKIEKAPNATRLMVFGDSMAVDVAKALERAHAEDPNLAVIGQGVGSSGFVRDDFFDWNKAIEDQIAADAFDFAIMIIGINDRQNLGAAKPLTAEWSSEYQARITRALNAFRTAGKPVIWVGLPPMEQPSYSQAISEINSIQRLASVANGAEFVDIYERFVDEAGKYSAYGPDLNGKNVRMRKDDGIHFSAAGADKVAFYLNASIRLFYRGGGGVSIEVADALAGTDAAVMVRPPFQGLGQIRLLEVAGAVIPLTSNQRRSNELLTAAALPEPEPAGFDLEMLIGAPVGRADAFGVGRAPESEDVAEARP